MRLSAYRGGRAQSPGQREIYQYRPTLPMPYPCIVVSTWHSPIDAQCLLSLLPIDAQCLLSSRSSCSCMVIVEV